MPPRKTRVKVDRDRPKPKSKGVSKHTLARDLLIQEKQKPAQIATIEQIKHLRELWD